MSTIVLHDYYESAEGGGRLSSILANGIDADLGYGFARDNHPFIQGAKHNPREHDLRTYSRLPVWRQLKLALAFQKRTAFLKNYQTVLYSGFYTPLAIVNHQQGQNLLYCHTPPRFIYDQRDFYLSLTPFFARPLLLAFIRYLQPRYEAAVERMDILIANSQNVRRRIRQYLRKDAAVVYPPCDTDRFLWQGQGDYYLSLGRLDPLKRVDLIVRAFLKMPDKRLIVASGGPEFTRLKKLAQDARNIRFTSWVDEQSLNGLIGNAIAAVYLPKDEDFGMSPLESMAAGKPVIGVAEGGLLESIVPDETGILLPPDFTPETIIAAVEKLNPARSLEMRKSCELRAHAFRIEVFLEQMRKYFRMG
ncbi:MAG: glycosyltransferase family 4 protein [Gammaproteobacteria bacterium]|nr:glycosyltransferase family 4 protein [Gammaproteobacteria bacterium]